MYQQIITFRDVNSIGLLVALAQVVKEQSCIRLNEGPDFESTGRSADRAVLLLSAYPNMTWLRENVSSNKLYKLWDVRGMHSTEVAYLLLT